MSPRRKRKEGKRGRHEMASTEYKKDEEGSMGFQYGTWFTPSHITPTFTKLLDDHVIKSAMEPTSEPVQPPPPAALRGSCACGLVSYSSSTLPIAITTCHCLPCRKASGAPFLTFGLYHNSALLWDSPTKAIKVTSSSKIAVRGTCGACGTPLFMKYHCRPDGTSVTLGTVDEKTVMGKLPPLKEHIFLAEKADWWELASGDVATRHENFNGPFRLRLQEWEATGRKLRQDLYYTAGMVLHEETGPVQNGFN